ncbi:hypothetical protein M422DRAFT_183156 [Sphaerobolus stellatus SS14]|uniref:Ribosomal RNA-processing protein 9 n=1 Tax=Sphaerobolus stellatus (strain SS14) TaxID=990650 RepID=A0A0C9V7Y2_SPHS4|nr:hypothetical protein M422DRAFT_183156 [Sphaerobolus stellatus SS14]
MPDAFFASTKKRKRPSQGGGSGPQRKTARTKGKPAPARPKKNVRDEELESEGGSGEDIDDLDLRASEVDENESDREEYKHETPAEKRLRLAKIYLESLKEGMATGEFDAADVDREIISARLKEDVLEHAGKLHIYIGNSLALDNPAPSRLRLKPHRLAVTSVALSNDTQYIYSSGKEGGIAVCDLTTGKRLGYVPKLRPSEASTTKGKGKGKALNVDGEGHVDEVLSVALSGDGKYLASGGKDRKVGVWEVTEKEGEEKKLRWVKGFMGHKDTILGLSFRKGTNSLYSASSDRTLKVFDLSPTVMGYVETLFGHQEAITGLDSLRGDSAISSGGRDRTVRLWKIADETQLVFRGGGTTKSKLREILEGGIEDDQEQDLSGGNVKRKQDMQTWVEGSLECVAMVDEQTFLSGGDSGSICLWTTGKKKPNFTFTTAHGLEETESATEGTLRRPRWITSLACLRYGDVFASGSWDGQVRLWKIDPSLRSFTRIGSFEVPGIINSLQLISIPRGWDTDKAWTKTEGQIAPPQKSQANGNAEKKNKAAVTNGATPTPSTATRGEEGVLLAVGVGQEPRIGRWLKVKGDGAVNSVVLFSIRTKGRAS